LEASPLAYSFTLGENLLEDAIELQSLPTKMRQLHNWYKGQAKSRTIVFGVRLPKDIYHTGADQMWVPFECLFNVFQKRDLNNQILRLWTMIISLLCSMEAHQCKLKNKTDIAFLDPVIVNKNTCKGIHSNPRDTIANFLKVFKECQDKEKQTPGLQLHVCIPLTWCFFLCQVY
ncbi:hypothetical protein BAE44_0003206, partial [Dichanthelium oligosanthes]